MPAPCMLETARAMSCDRLSMTRILDRTQHEEPEVGRNAIPQYKEETSTT